MIDLKRFYTKESHLRSLAKAFSWRIWGTVISIVIAYIITGNVGESFAIGGIEFIGKLFIYYAHERIWDFIPWGLKVNKAQDD